MSYHNNRTSEKPKYNNNKKSLNIFYVVIIRGERTTVVTEDIVLSCAKESSGNFQRIHREHHKYLVFFY